MPLSAPEGPPYALALIKDSQLGSPCESRLAPEDMAPRLVLLVKISSGATPQPSETSPRRARHLVLCPLLKEGSAAARSGPGRALDRRVPLLWLLLKDMSSSTTFGSALDLFGTRDRHAGRRISAASRARALMPRMSPPPPADLVRQVHRESFFHGSLLEEVWDWLRSRAPYLVRFRGQAVITRPTEIFGLQRGDGAYPCYQWGQMQTDYALIEATPAPILECARLIEANFDLEAGYLNSQLVTYYVHGEHQYIKIHQDVVGSLGEMKRGSCQSDL